MVKLVHARTGEVHRVSASDSASFGALGAQARALFGDDAALRYRDDEGDLVTVASGAV